MNSQINHDKAEFEIDLINMLRVLWEKLWIIVLSMVICGAIAFSSAVFLVAPKFTATATMYVNNSASVGNSTITFSSSQISAAKSLLDVYVIILKSRTTLNDVLKETGLNYTYGQLKSMISAGPVNGTEVFSISATCSDAETAEKIVNAIVDILPKKISYVVEGSSVKTIDPAVVPTSRSSPSYTRYAIIGVLVGAALSIFSIVMEDLLNTSVRDEEYLKNRYNLPILAVVPELYDPDSKSRYRGYSYKYGYRNRFRYRYRYRYKYQMYGYYAGVSEDDESAARATERKDNRNK